MVEGRESVAESARGPLGSQGLGVCAEQLGQELGQSCCGASALRIDASPNPSWHGRVAAA